MKSFFKDRQGMVLANSLVIMTLLVVIGIALISIMLANSAYIGRQTMSSQAISIAEGGIEKALWELNQQGSIYDGELNNQTIEGGAFDIEMEEIDSTSRYLTAIAYIPNREDAKVTRKVRIRIRIQNTDTGAAFHYGVQVGDLGITMSNNAKIYGNVYSAGNIAGGQGSYISGSAYCSKQSGLISGNNNSQRIAIGGDANAHTLRYLNIAKDAYYFSSATLISSTVSGDSYPNSPIPEEIPLPISEEKINEWKGIAESGGSIGAIDISNGSTLNLGPKKIEGNLAISNLSTLNVTGVLWVTGNINFYNNAIIKLDESYGTSSGMIIADGKIDVSPNVTMGGSGDPESFIMNLTTYPGTTLANPAINAGNNSDAVVYYAQNGIVEVRNNAELMSITGKGLHLSNGAEVNYDVGLTNVNFSTGPGGIWSITPSSWELIK